MEVKVLYNLQGDAVLILDLINHSGSTAADDKATYIITDSRNFTLNFHLPPISRTFISKHNAKFALIWKDNFGPLSNSPVLFLLCPGKKLLTLLGVQDRLYIWNVTVAASSWRRLCLVALDVPTPVTVLVKLSQVLQLMFLCNPFKAAVMQLSITLFPSSQLWGSVSCESYQQH